MAMQECDYFDTMKYDAEYHKKNITINNTSSSDMSWTTYLNNIGAAINTILTNFSADTSNQGKMIEFVQISGFPRLWNNRYSYGSTSSILAGISTTLNTSTRYDAIATFRESGSIYTMTTFSGTSVQYSNSSSDSAISAKSSKTVNIIYAIYETKID